MTKVIVALNIKMPKNSNECPFFEPWKGYDRYDYCPIHRPTTTVIGDSSKRCDGCPLKNPPKKYKAKTRGKEYLDGWNDCLSKIIGE